MNNQTVPGDFEPARRAWMAAVGVGAGLFALQGGLAAQRKPDPKAPTEEELKKAYEETENLVKVGSNPDRPGIAAWQQKQGMNLTWPAKYYLPWPAGVGHQVYQSWNGNKIGPPRATHMQAQNYYAWDFHIVRGQYICAARDGKVTNVVDDQPPGNENANVIYIEHADGEVSVYAHNGSNTALVAVGDKVLAGQKICQGSNESMHLHFCIWKGMIDYPCRFIDFAADNGVPQYGQNPVSGNKGPDSNQIAEIQADFNKGEAAFEKKDYLNALKWYLAATATEVRVEAYERSLERIEECRQIIDAEINAAVEEARGGDMAKAEKSLKAIQKKYGDFAKTRINAAMDELKKDPKFRDWANKQASEKLWLEARRAEKFEEWKKAEAAYRELRKLYKKGEPEYDLIQEKLKKISIGRILEE
ncbi:MAG: peptidoglycan DD-metalloendopeptidase family protein [Planctomycetes bacterium]|nr:peptidoglycan DD-metalloendopeptidase family protein [Planctomycetota bacterium]MCW8134651.1 peptidoglycan DD-metalloendopeptidase family protein [Planctomycetota bacterium]